MFYVHLLLFSILLYNTEARWYDEDYSEQISYTVLPSDGAKAAVAVSNATTINGTYPEPVIFTNLNATVPVEPTYILNKTEEPREEPYYPDWYDKPKHTTTTESSHDDYTITTKPYDNNDEYGYLTIENGYLTAHFPETSNKTEINSSGVNQTIGKNTTAGTDNSEYWGNKTEHSVTNTTKRPYYYDWFTTTTRRSPWFIHRYPNSTGGAHHYHYPSWWTHSYNGTNFTSSSVIRRRPYWWETTTSTKPPYRWWERTTERTYWPETEYNRNSTDYATYYPYYIRSTTPPSLNQSIFLNVTNATSIYGAVVDFLKKLARNISSSGVKIVPNANVTNVALATGNGNTIVYANNYF